MASTLLTKPFPSRPPLASRLHFSSRSFATYRHRGVRLSTCSCTGNLLLQKSFRELSVSVNVVGGGGDRAMSTSVETSSKVGSSFHLFQNVQNGMDNLTPQQKSRVLRGRSPVCASSSSDPSGGLGHESNVYMDGYAPPHTLPNRYGSLVDSINRKPGPPRAAGIQGGNISPGTNPSDGDRPADVYVSDGSPAEESNPMHPGAAQQNSTFQPSPNANRPPPEVPRTAGTYRTPLFTNSPVEGGFNRSQASPSRPYSTSTGSVEGSYRPIEGAGSPSNPSYSPQQPGNTYKPPQGGSVYPHQQQEQQPGYSANTNRPGQNSRFNNSYRPEAKSAGRNFGSVTPSRQSGSPRGGSYRNTQGNVRPANFNTAQEGTNASASSSNGAGSNDVPQNASKSPTDREPSAAAAVIDKYLGPSTLKLEKRDSSSPPPPPPPRKYPNTTEKKSGKDLVAESAACAVIEKYLGPWPGFPPRDPKIDEYLDSLPENAACAAIDKYFGPYKPLFVFKKNEGENANNSPPTSRPTRNRNTSRSGPRSRTWNPSQGASTSRPWTPPSQVSTDGQDRSPP